MPFFVFLFIKSTSEIKKRIEKLDSEWDIERVLELNAGLFALTGVILSVTKNKNWIWLPGIVTTFLILHAVQGWCPPLPLFRMMKIRMRKEIDKEKYGLIEILKQNNYVHL